MQKHPQLTLGRVKVFLDSVLRHGVYGERAPLKIEVADTPCRTQSEAMASSWTEVASGHRYGPAYTTFWFRLSGRIPEHFAGQPVAVIADIGGERTVWKDGSPWVGVDHEHPEFAWKEGSAATHGGTPCRGGEALEYYVEVYTRNSEIRLAGKEPPRQPLTETVGKAEIVTVDPDVRALLFDVEFAVLLLETYREDDPFYTLLLRALNDVCNLYAEAGRGGLARARKLIRDAMASVNHELGHAIVPVGHAHLDTAWLWPLSITRQKMAHTTATQLGLLERYPEYVFVHSQASQYEWLEKDYPQLFERVKQAIRDGRWEVVGSMWVEADCNLTGAESLVRQFLYGKRYFREKLGVETKDMWLPDVFGYSANLPQILKKFEIDYFLTQKISWNQFNKFPHHTFLWQGIDGTKVWTHFPPADTYNASAEPKEVVYSVQNYKDSGRSDASLYVFGFGDGGGGPTERHLEFLRRGRLAPGYPAVNSGKKALDFFREAKSRSKDLLTWSGELYLELHRGTYTTQANTKKGNRDSEFLMRDAELLACFDPDFPRSYPHAEIEALWKLVLLNQFHDIIPGSSVREVYEDAERDYGHIRRESGQMIHDTLKRIGERLDRDGMTRPVALFQNAETVTEASVPAPVEGTPPSSLTCGEETVPVQLVEWAGERKLIFPTPQAALGAVALGDFSDAPTTGRTRLKAGRRSLENDELSVRFDAHGNITNVTSLDDKTEFIEPGKLGNLFQLFDDVPNFWGAWDIDAFALETGQDLVRSESFEIMERGPVRVAAEIVKKIGERSTLRQRISLGPTPGIRFDTEIDWREDQKLLKVAFPLNVNSPRATYEIQFGNVERPTHANTSWDMAKFEVAHQKWMDLSEGEQGAALLNDGKYGADIRGSVMRLSLLRAAKAPDPIADMGVHRFTYVLMPHFGPYNYAGVVPAAYAINAPMRHAFLDAGAGRREAAGVRQLPALVSTQSRNLVIESVKRAEDGPDLIVRLYECHNARGRAELSCARPFSRASLCDLQENPVADLDLDSGMVVFDYKPFEILTIRLHR